MRGLEQVYVDLDGVRKRLIRLVEMDRLPKAVGEPLRDKVLGLQREVEDVIKGEDDGTKEA